MLYNTFMKKVLYILVLITLGVVFSTPVVLGQGPAYCTDWVAPTCDNAGNSIEFLQANHCPQLKILTVGRITANNINSYSQGCVVDQVHQPCGYTINLVVNGVPRSVPISNYDWETLYTYGEDIQISIIW